MWNRIRILSCLLLSIGVLQAQSKKGMLKEVTNEELFHVLSSVDARNVLLRSNDYFQMKAIKMMSDERIDKKSDISDYKCFYYIIIVDYDPEQPNGKLYKTKNLIAPDINVFPDSYKFFKIHITHGKKQEKQLLLFASNEKLYVKKE